MTFDFVIFVAALYALTSETIEDVFMLIIYQALFGRKSVLLGLVAASITVAVILVVLGAYGIPNLEPYSEYIATASGLFLTGLGTYWIVKFFHTRTKHKRVSGFEQKTTSTASFALVFSELLEILAILAPFILTNHILETSASILVSILVSATLMIFIGKRLRQKLENRLVHIKLFAGASLIISGLIMVSH